MLKITKCPHCGSAKIKRVKRNWTGDFQGQVYTVVGLEFYECPTCDEKIYDRQAMKKIEAHSPAYVKIHP